jgi:Family of unknown function (DUF5938)/Saccharopine dehydrogenase NADP binding domain
LEEEMPAKRPVIVYGASGFSGRLAAEYLAEYQIPFVAAGRNRAKIADVMKNVPGIEKVDHEVAEVENSVPELAKLFSGAKVVCNTVGPFIYSGPIVIEACLRASCHYLDISGEQAWIREVAEKWGPQFAEKRLLAAPATAFMSAPSDAVVRICAENPGLDTFEVLTMFRGAPTYGSTQTIFAVLQTEAYFLEQNQYKRWPPATALEVVAPGQIQTQLALAWGGFPHPVWFKDHPQVANVKSFGGLLDRQIMENVFATEKLYLEHIGPLPKAEREQRLSAMANSVQAGTPPREDRGVNRTIDVIVGRGATEFTQCALFGNCCYKQTGLIQAYAAQHLIQSAACKFGFASVAEAFGARELLQALEDHGLSRMKVMSAL